MDTIFSRQGTEAIFETGARVTVDPHESVLSLLNGRIPLYNGDDFTKEPYYVHNTITGKRRKKMVLHGGHENGIMIWAKKLEPSWLAEAEAALERARQRINPQRHALWEEMMAGLQRVKTAHAVPVHHLGSPSNRDGKDEIWEYHLGQVYGQTSYSSKWVPRPKRMRNARVGQMVYENERKLEALGKRYWKFWDAFLTCCTRYIHMHAEMGPMAPNFIVLTINGREYAFENREYGLAQTDFQRLPNVNR